MSSTVLDARWAAADVDAPALWAESGGQWLTGEGVQVPSGLTRVVAGLVAYLDRHGAGLASISTAEGVGLLAERAAWLGFGRAGLDRSGTVSCGGATRLMRCTDGWIAVSLARPDDIASVSAWLGIAAESWAGSDPWPVIEAVLADREAEAVVDQAIALGLACTAVGSTTDARPLLVERLGEAPVRPLDGATVVNLSSLWAGPLAADVLARLGARVINVESTTRPDGARHTPAFFDALHGRSESVALELSTRNGRRQLSELLAAVDVVIEGSRPRALEQMGIHANDIVRRGPKVWMSITAHGRDAPHGERVGFGDDAAAAGGLLGWVDAEPRFIADAVADPLAGLTSAAAAVQLLDSPGRWLADVALSRVAAAAATGAEHVASSPGVRSDPPRARTDRGRALALGRDTVAVLTEFGIDAVSGV